MQAIGAQGIFPAECREFVKEYVPQILHALEILPPDQVLSLCTKRCLPCGLLQARRMWKWFGGTAQTQAAALPLVTALQHQCGRHGQLTDSFLTAAVLCAHSLTHSLTHSLSLVPMPGVRIRGAVRQQPGRHAGWTADAADKPQAAGHCSSCSPAAGSSGGAEHRRLAALPLLHNCCDLHQGMPLGCWHCVCSGPSKAPVSLHGSASLQLHVSTSFDSAAPVGSLCFIALLSSRKLMVFPARRRPWPARRRRSRLRSRWRWPATR